MNEDKDGVLRPIDGNKDGKAICDMGAYEYYDNHPPLLDQIGIQNINEGKLLQFTITAADPDGDTLCFSARELPSGANFNPDTRQFSWKPGYNQAGRYEIIFTVTDNGEPPLSDTKVITVIVNNRSSSSQHGNILNTQWQFQSYWNQPLFQLDQFSFFLSHMFDQQWLWYDQSWYDQSQIWHQPFHFQTPISYYPQFSNLFPSWWCQTLF